MVKRIDFDTARAFCVCWKHGGEVVGYFRWLDDAEKFIENFGKGGENLGIVSGSYWDK